MKEGTMGMMKMMVVLLVLFNLCFPASFAPLANSINLGNSSNKVREKRIGDTNNDSITGGGVGAVNQSKFSGSHSAGGGGHGGGGHSAGGGGHSVGGGGHSAGGGGHSAETGGGGRATSSPREGGAAGIPVYGGAGGAGAAGQRNNHRGAAGICIRCQKGVLPIHVAITLLTSLLLRVSV